MGIVAFFAGLAPLLHLSTTVDALTLTSPGWLLVALQVSYLLSGIGMLFGVALARRDLEGFGVVLLGTAVLVRFIAVVAVSGLTGPVLVLLVFYTGIVAACVVRMRHLVTGAQLILIHNTGESDATRSVIAEGDLQMTRDDDGEDDA